MASSGNGTTAGTGSPCGACKFLRRKCASDCIFAPYFSSEQGAARFAAIHKVFGASNVSKLLLNVPIHDRCEAVVTIAYEAQARLHDPVYGCVSHIFALQQQVIDRVIVIDPSLFIDYLFSHYRIYVVVDWYEISCMRLYVYSNLDD